MLNPKLNTGAVSVRERRAYHAHPGLQVSDPKPNKAGLSPCENACVRVARVCTLRPVVCAKQVQLSSDAWGFGFGVWGLGGYTVKCGNGIASGVGGGGV